MAQRTSVRMVALAMGLAVALAPACKTFATEDEGITHGGEHGSSQAATENYEPSAVPAITEPPVACGTPAADLPGVPGRERLLTSGDVGAVKAFAEACLEVPNPAVGANATLSVRSPCGAPLPSVPLTDAMSVRFGQPRRGLDAVLIRPGRVAADDLVAQLRADLQAGCGPSVGVGGDQVASDVTPVELAGIPGGVAVTWRQTVPADPATGTVPAPVGRGLVAVAHGDELLVLLTVSDLGLTADEVVQLATASMIRAGW